MRDVSLRRGRSVALALAAVVLAAGILHVCVGGVPLPFRDVALALLGQPTDAATELMVLEFRLPRTVAAILAGAGLGVAGALTQTVARNPLASPDILGITGGASFGAVAVMALAARASGLPPAFHAWGLPVAAALGGIGAATLVFALVWRHSLEGNRLILVGLGMNGLAVALTSWMLTLGEVVNAQQALTWMAGSINGAEWRDLGPAAVVIALGLGLAAALRTPRQVLALDSDTASGLGLPVGPARVVILGLATLLAVAACVVAGPLAFVALASGHVARMLTRGDIPPVLGAALIGALFVLLADLAAARLFAVALPAGVATAVIGAPYLIYLVVLRQRSATVR